MPGFDADNHYLKDVEVGNLSLGMNGAIVETGTTAITGEFHCVQCLADTVFASYTNNWSGDSLTGTTISAGTHLFGRWTAFTLTSGKVIAYKISD